MKRTHYIAIAIAAAAMAAGTIAFFATRPRTVVVATSGLDEASYKAVEALVGAAIRRHPDMSIELEPRPRKDEGLKDALAGNPKPALVFFLASAESDALADKFAAPSQDRIGLFSRSFLWPVLIKGKVYAYPVFFDHFEFDRLKTRTVPPYDGTLESFGAAIGADASAAKGQTVLACGDDRQLAALASSLP